MSATTCGMCGTDDCLCGSGRITANDTSGLHTQLEVMKAKLEQVDTDREGRRCPQCKGMGSIPGVIAPTPCPRCRNTGLWDVIAPDTDTKEQDDGK